MPASRTSIFFSVFHSIGSCCSKCSSSSLQIKRRPLARASCTESSAIGHNYATALQESQIDHQIDGRKRHCQCKNIEILFGIAGSRHRRRGRDSTVQGKRNSNMQRRRSSGVQRRRMPKTIITGDIATSQAIEQRRRDGCLVTESK